MPSASRDSSAVVRAPEGGVSANHGLRPCPAPALQPPGSDEVVHASHPAQVTIERFPAVTKPFPAIASEAPLPEIASRPPAVAASPGQGPALVAPGATRKAEREVLAPSLKSARADVIRSTPTRPRAVDRPLASEPSAAAAAGPANSQPPWQPPLSPPGLLPPLAPRSAEIEAVAKQAERQVRRGYDLAARGAIFYARSQFIQALRTIAQALDAQDGTHRHSEALGAGLAALEEAEDFVPRGSNVEADLDVGLLVRGHRTPVMKEASPLELTALSAQQKYYTFAQEQLAIAAGHEEAGSMALFGLGKAYGTLGAQRSLQTVAAEPKAMVFHQAALAVDAGNYLAANELAVYEARYGRFESARALLEHCASLAPQAAVWKNLARVHRSLGETQLAAAAEARAADAERRETALAAKPNANAAAPGDIQWVDATTFEASSKPASDLQRPANAAEPKSAPPVEEAQRLLPWLPRASRQAPSAAQR